MPACALFREARPSISARRSGLYPHEPNCIWLMAAEMAAYAIEASRWDWGPRARQVAALARRLAHGIYEEAPVDDLTAVVVELSGLLHEERASATPEEWLASLGPSALLDSLRRSFQRLRYHLYEEGPPQAA